MTNADSEQQHTTFDQFCSEWLEEFNDPGLSSREKGQRFAFKLVTQWLDVPEGDEDLILCDGSGDGGIDVAYLRRAVSDYDGDEDETEEGDTWYLVQSKYGSSYQGQETIFQEGRKVIATLTGENQNVSETTRWLVGRLGNFVERASPRDRLVLVLATTKPMSEEDRRAWDDIRELGKNRFPGLFDVEDISLQTLWEKTGESLPSISVEIQGDFVEPSAGLRVGTIPLTKLFDFLKDYKRKTGNLDQLYERNVRQFLGGRRKINRGIANTLANEPDMFGLYNNGITIVVADFVLKSNALVLHDPYVVNGCQTTRTIWDVLQQKLDSGGTGESAATVQWRNQAERGVVVTKIVKSNNAQISDITRYTNSQNAVREQDFIALRGDFRTWAEEMADKYGIFLEIQRGGWEAQKAFQRANPSQRQFSEGEYANAFDLIKVYSAGWLREPGSAFGQNAPFSPGGRIFGQVTTGEYRIGAEDLYAAHRLHKLSNQYGFGRGASQLGRRQTRFLYYFAVLDLLRDTMIRSSMDYSPPSITKALLLLMGEGNEDALQGLLDAAIDVVDEYLTPEHDDSLFKEPEFTGDLNTFLKNNRLGKELNSTPMLSGLLALHRSTFGRSVRGQQSPRAEVIGAINNGMQMT